MSDREPAKVRRSRERVGADTARVWARELSLGNPYAKAILLAVANYMNEDGSAWPGMATISRDTDISEETVAKRLRWLEGIGAVALFKAWRDENGRRNFDGAGKPTSSEIRFLFDADTAAIERAAQASVEPRPLRGVVLRTHLASIEGKKDNPDESQSEQISHPHGRGLISNQHPSSTLVAPNQPSSPADCHIDSELQSESRDSPQAPLRGDVSVQDQELEETKVPGWDTFKTEYESDGNPIVRVSLAKGLFAALTENEGIRCTKALRGMMAWRRGQKKPPAKPSAQTVIREIEAWPTWANYAPPDPPAPKPKHVFASDSLEFAALALCRAIARFAPFRHETNAYTYAGDIPSGAENLAALVRFRGESKEPDQSDWIILPKDSKRYVAWCQRVKEWLGVWPEAHRYWLDANGFIVATVRDAEGYGEPGKLPRSVDGLLLPRTENGWPPTKSTTSEDVHVGRDDD